jgi:spore maturation protein CgeB
MRSLRILYVAMEFEYGRPDLGVSFEETNFKSSLLSMGHELTHFDFMTRLQSVGRSAMRRELISTAGLGNFDLVFFFLFQDQIDGATIRSVRSAAGAPTVNWFADDHWRFDDFTRRIGSEFDLCITTDEDSLDKYARAGIDNVILSQWACNPAIYHPSPTSEALGVTFVGQPHGDRRETIEALANAGIDSSCWGHGWPLGRVSTDRMIEIFSSSAINLNLANSSRPTALQRLQHRMSNRGRPARSRPPQIKGRTFEIPGCGGFQLTDNVPHIGRYFEPGREIALYDSREELVDQVHHWLSHPQERADIARAGYERVMRDHTYAHRFAAIFDRLAIS